MYRSFCDTFFRDFFESCIVIDDVYYLPFNDFADFQIRIVLFCVILLLFGCFLGNLLNFLFGVLHDLIRNRIGGKSDG